MTAKDIQKALFKLKQAAKYNICNVYFFNEYKFGECDFLSIGQNDYICSFEVKVSKSDYKADFLKEKKHQYLSSVNRDKLNIPNKFYYVCPENLIKVEEVPDYAGLVYVKDGFCTEIKKAPFLHKTKINYERNLNSKLYYGYLENWYAKCNGEYAGLKREIAELKKNRDGWEEQARGYRKQYYELISENRQLKKQLDEQMDNTI